MVTENQVRVQVHRMWLGIPATRIGICAESHCCESLDMCGDGKVHRNDYIVLLVALANSAYISCKSEKDQRVEFTFLLISRE